MRYRLLIFDFDGTLADTFPAFLRAFQEAIPRFGLPAVGPEELARLRGMEAKEIIRFLKLPLWKVPRVGKFVRERMAAEPLRLFPGMEEILPTLATSGTTLAIVSSNSEANIRTVLGTKLAHLFNTFACGVSLFGKAARFRQVLKRTDLPAAETLTIGDELRDAKAAQAAGIAFGAVAWGYTEVTALQQSAPAAVFHTPADLLALREP